MKNANETFLMEIFLPNSQAKSFAEFRIKLFHFLAFIIHSAAGGARKLKLNYFFDAEDSFSVASDKSRSEC
jgi:hypothetical protein